MTDKIRFLESENQRFEKMLKNKTKGVVGGSGGYMASKAKPTEEEESKPTKKSTSNTGRAVLSKSKPLTSK